MRPVVAALAVAALAGCSGGGGGPTTTAATSTTRPAPSSVPAAPPAGAVPTGLRDLAPGQCFLLPRGDTQAEDRAVWVVDCREVHTHEVVDVVTYAGPVARGGGYAGTSPVQDWSEAACYDRFEPFVGAPWTRSDLDIEVWWPSQESWGRGDRKVVCTVFPEDGSAVSGSRRGSKS
ncbi:MAG: septum formation family protein [Microthrixaceae bacterium]